MLLASLWVDRIFSKGAEISVSGVRSSWEMLVKKVIFICAISRSLSLSLCSISASCLLSLSLMKNRIMKIPSPILPRMYTSQACHVNQGAGLTMISRLAE